MQAFRAVLRVLFFNRVNITGLSVVLFELVVLGERAAYRIPSPLKGGVPSLYPPRPILCGVGVLM